MTGFNDQSRPPGRAPEGLEGSRRGELSIAEGRDRRRRVGEVTLVDLWPRVCVGLVEKVQETDLREGDPNTQDIQGELCRNDARTEVYIC